MRLSQNIRATRVKGTLEVELEDGRTGTLEVDIDVSIPGTAWGVEHQYSEPDQFRYFSDPVRLLSSKFYVELPSSIHRSDDPSFLLKIPVDD
jgi:hypothetical protein